MVAKGRKYFNDTVGMPTIRAPFMNRIASMNRTDARPVSAAGHDACARLANPRSWFTKSGVASGLKRHFLHNTNMHPL